MSPGIYIKNKQTSYSSNNNGILYSEIGMDLNNIQAKKVAVYTDSTVSWNTESRIELGKDLFLTVHFNLDRQTSSSQGSH